MLLQASPHPAAIDWQHRATANGGNTHNLHREAANRLCKGLDSAGLSAKAVEIYPFLGDNVPAICTKLFYAKVGSSPVCRTVNFVSTNIISFGGLKDSVNSTRSLLTDMVYSTALGFREADTSAHFYTRDTAAAGTSQVAIGSLLSGNNVTCGWLSAGSKETGVIATTVTASGTSTSTAGFHGSANLTSRATQYFLNGVATGTVGGTGTGSWVASSNAAVLFANPTTAYWKRDMLYADFFGRTTAADELRLSQVVKDFQRSLNRS